MVSIITLTTPFIFKQKVKSKNVEEIHIAIGDFLSKMKRSGDKKAKKLKNQTF